MSQAAEKSRAEGPVGRFLQGKGIYLMILLFLSLFMTGLRVLDPADGGLLQLRTARSDFEDYYNASVRMRKGEDLYNMEAVQNMGDAPPPVEIKNTQDLLEFAKTPEGRAYLQSLKGAGSYLYLPFFSWALLPLSWFSYEVAAVLFQVVSLLSLAAFFLLVGRLRSDLGQKFWYLAFLACIPVLSFLSENSANANVGFLLIFLSGAGLLLTAPELSGNDDIKSTSWMSILGGALLGIAAIIKIMPAILGLFLLSRRNFRAIGAAVASALLCFLLPISLGGWQQSVHWHQDWSELMLHTYSQYGVVRPYANNQTISAALSKLFVAGSDPKQIPLGLPFFFTSIEDLGTTGAFWLRASIKSLVYGLTAFMVFLSILFSLRRKFSDVRYRLAQIYFIQALVLVSLIVSGVSWFHAYSLLLVPVTFRMMDSAPQRREELWMLVLVGFSGVGNMIFPGLLRDIFAMFSVHTWLMLLLSVWSVLFSIRILRKEPLYG